MKTIKILALSIVCVLSFCSCQKDARTLCWGYWKVDADASYITENGKRHYVGEMQEDNAIKEITFWEKYVFLESVSGDTEMEKCHFDKDCLIVKGVPYRIIESSPQSMIIESCNKDSDVFSRFKLDRRKYDSFFKSLGFKTFLGIAYYRLNVPYWLRYIIFLAAIGALVLVAVLVDNKTFTIVLSIIGAIVVIIYFYVSGEADGMFLALT